MMKTRYKIIILASLIGVLFWVFDAAIEYLWIRTDSFAQVLLKGNTGHEIIIRLIALIFFVICGLIMSSCMLRRNCVEKHLKQHESELINARDELENRVQERTRLLQEKTTELEELNRDLEKRIKEGIKKQLQQEQILVQQSRLAAMGEMVGAIGHKWRQPLATISIILQRLKRASMMGKLDKETLEEISADGLEQVKKMAAALDDFRNYFKPGKAVENFAVIESVRETIALMRSQMDNNRITLHLDFDEKNSQQALGHPGDFKLVLVNILRNAINAIIEGRQKKTKKRDHGDIFIEIRSGGRRITIKLSNNGIPIPPSIMKKIFEPGSPQVIQEELEVSQVHHGEENRQKEGKVGLYTSKLIIENQMGGSISARSNIEGTVFTIKLRQKV